MQNNFKTPQAQSQFNSINTLDQFNTNKDQKQGKSSKQYIDTDGGSNTQVP